MGDDEEDKIDESEDVKDWNWRMNTKQLQSIDIERKTAEFLASGGAIQIKDSTDNKGFQVKKHETRAEVRARSKRQFKVKVI